MTYKFHYYITNEDDEEVLGSSTFIDSGFERTGNYENVELEIARAMRNFKSYLLQLEDDEETKQAEEKGSEDGVDLKQD